MRTPPSLASAFPKIALWMFAGAALVLPPGCGNGGDDGDGPGGGAGEVMVLTSRASILAVTGGAELEIAVLQERLDGQVLMSDSVSSSVVKIDLDGGPTLFTSEDALLAVTGAATVRLGPIDVVREGELRGAALVADEVSGSWLLIDLDGTPRLFTTKEKVTFQTGEADASLAFPHELTNGQFVAQELITRDILKFDARGNALPFVAAGLLGNAAGVASTQAFIAGWARGPVSRSLFVRLASTNNIVQIQVNGSVRRHVSGATLAALFPDIADLRVLDMIGDVATDNLLLLIGDGDRGIALARVSPVGPEVSVFTSPARLRQAAGDSVDVSDLVLLRTGTAIAIDRGGAQAIAFQLGNPLVLALKEEIEEATGVLEPDIARGVGLGFGGVLLPDAASDSLLLVR